MTDTNETRRRILPARRLTLLGSVAIVGTALVFGGGLVSGQLGAPAFAAPTQVQSGPVGFADLIGKVKPAVISVKVKIDRGVEQSADSDSPQGNDDDMQQFQGTPFEKFFRQYGENGPGQRMPHHQMFRVVLCVLLL
jgi:serine protease Do